tara:strand:+ start:63 stop:575 length:513 start_codon:yes stop_codon:yes gene_type:complete
MHEGFLHSMEEVMSDMDLNPRLGDNFFGLGIKRFGDVIEKQENTQDFIQAWRSGESKGNNNPGNLRDPKNNMELLKFSTYKEGRKALEQTLRAMSGGRKGPYSSKPGQKSIYYSPSTTVRDFVTSYAFGPDYRDKPIPDLVRDGNLITKASERELERDNYINAIFRAGIE